MTLWPGVPLLLPPFPERREEYRLHDSGLALIGTGEFLDVRGRDVRLGEVYLELSTLDLDDPTELLAFAQKYGTLSGSLVHLALAGDSLFSGLFAGAVADGQVRNALIEGDPALQPVFGLHVPEVTTLASFRFAAALLRDLSDAWRLANADPALAASPHRWQLDYPVDEETKLSRFFAVLLLTAGLPRLLERFHPYVRMTPAAYDDEADEEAETLEEEEEVETHAEVAPYEGVLLKAATSLAFVHQLAEFCALELYNHIAGAEVYRQCENETCGRPFVRQYGRAVQWQTRREGVKYCSSYCAQAQASRMYRRRRRARTRSN
jgi:hypothetical protein